MTHEHLIAYLTSANEESDFSTSVGKSGGYVNFTNSGRGGSVKEFTLSFESILGGLNDILQNIEIFKELTTYSETPWRDAGARYFLDLVLNSMITVQTKPTFTTFSKLICWANRLLYRDGYIPIDEDKIQKAITKLKELTKSYEPKVIQNPLELIDSTQITLLPKPFILLAGISGTGKTRFVREQANSNKSNYEIVAVRPDWHEPSDLLGYVSRIGSDGVEYVVTDVLKFMVKAWKSAIATANTDAATLKPLNEIEPYWLCLDEMNLAPVEQYFSDYLSVLESRVWTNGEYQCDSLLKLDALQTILKSQGMEKLKQHLDLDGEENKGLWDYFCAKGIPLPPNLIVAGTVNMDETTHGFSRKVLDRAFTIDFGEFFPNDYTHYLEPENAAQPLRFGFPVLTAVTKSDLASVVADNDGVKSIDFLTKVNEVLKGSPFELAYRALNELLLAVVCFSPKDDAELQAVWDDFLMTKVLPRIEGDTDKLRSDTDETSLLGNLELVLHDKLGAIWNATRPDLFRMQNDSDEKLAIETRSKKKLQWMETRLDANQFTSFWP